MPKWIGIDLDGTLAKPVKRKSIGEPNQEVVKFALHAHKAGYEIRLFTSRAAQLELWDVDELEAWCEYHLGFRPLITCAKDRSCIALLDDIAIHYNADTESVIIPASHQLYTKL